MTATPC